MDMLHTRFGMKAKQRRQRARAVTVSRVGMLAAFATCSLLGYGA